MTPTSSVDCLNSFFADTFKKEHVPKGNLCAKFPYFFARHNEVRKLNGNIQKLASSDELPQAMQATITKMRLTPLTISVMVGYKEAVSLLLDHGAGDIDNRDAQGWTPLHHARVLGFTEIEEMLITSNSSLKTVKNMWAATPDDLTELMKKKDSASGKKVFLYKDSDGRIRKGDAAKFMELCGARFIEGTEHCSHAVYESWLDTESSGLPGEHIELERPYAPLASRSASIYIGGGDRPQGYGVFAKVALKAGEIMGEYVGMSYASPRLGSRRYVLHQVDAEEARNEMALVNEGFPNAILTAIADCMPARGVLKLIRDVAEDEEILADYCTDELVKLSRYTVPDFVKITHFLERNPLISRPFMAEDMREGDTFERYLMTYSYIAQTPYVIFRLILEDPENFVLVQQMHTHPNLAKLPFLQGEFLQTPAMLKKLIDKAADREKIIGKLTESLDRYAVFAFVQLIKILHDKLQGSHDLDIDSEYASAEEVAYAIDWNMQLCEKLSCNQMDLFIQQTAEGEPMGSMSKAAMCSYIHPLVSKGGPYKFLEQHPLLKGLNLLREARGGSQ